MADGLVKDDLLIDTDERRALRESVAKLVGSYGRRYFQDVTRRGARPDELWADMGRAGYLGVHLPEEYGGGGGGLTDLAIVIEETAAQGCPMFMLVISPAIAGSLLTAHASAAQKETWLAGVADGTKRIAFAITEPDAGTNTHNITTTAHAEGPDSWRIRGQKYWTSGIDDADAVIVVARGAEPGPTGRHPISMFLVPTDAEGLSFQPIDSALQIPENQFTTFFDDVRVTRDDLVGVEGAGLAQVFAGLNPERVTAAAQANGIARFALARARALRHRPHRVVDADRRAPGHRPPAGRLLRRGPARPAHDDARRAAHRRRRRPGRHRERVHHREVRRGGGGGQGRRPGDPDPRWQRPVQRVRPVRPLVRRPDVPHRAGEPRDGPQPRRPAQPGPAEELLMSTLGDLLTRVTGLGSDRPAITLDDRTVTFGELDRTADQVARALAVAGLAPGDRVAVLLRNVPEFYALLFGAARAGVVLVALNWRLAPLEVAAILDDAEPRLLVVGKGQLALVPDEPPCALVLLEDLAAWTAEQTAEPLGRTVSPDDVVLQLYSSGTTGRPKGVRLTHANLLFTPRMGREFYGMGPESVNLVPSPLFHIGGVGYGLTALGQGGHTVLLSDLAPAHLLAQIERHRVTHAFVVPAVIAGLLAAPELGRTDLSSLQRIAYGGAPMTEALLRRAIEGLGCGFMAVYGMTETAGTVVSLAPEEHDPDGPRADLLRSVGRPLPWLEVDVADPLTGEPVGPGNVGEIRVRSGQNTVGYWRLAGGDGLGADPRRLAAHR